MSGRLDHIAINGPAIASMFKAKSDVKRIGHRLKALLEVRVSQINGCALIVCPSGRRPRFSMTKSAPRWPGPRRSRRSPRKARHKSCTMSRFDHCSGAAVVDLTLIIAQMNTWNRLPVAFAATPPAARLTRQPPSNRPFGRA